MKKVIPIILLLAVLVFTLAACGADELIAIADAPDVKYCLANNINLGGAVWTPLSRFDGYFDGEGHKIYNFILRTSGNGAFFGVNNGIIKNTVFDNFSFISTATSNACAGIIASTNRGTIDGCKIQNAEMSGTILTESYTMCLGGIAGKSVGIIQNCQISIEVACYTDLRYNTTTYALGFAVGSLLDGGIIQNCAVNGFLDFNAKLSGSGSEYVYIGGVAALSKNSTNAKNSSNITINVSCTYSNADNYFIIGGIEGETEGTISECYSNCNINSNSYYNQVGGISGSVYSSNGKINNSYACGSINISVGEYNIGGLVGRNDGTISYCYSAVDVNYTGSSSAHDIASFAGYVAQTGLITNCFTLGNITDKSGTSDWFSAHNYGGNRNCYWDKDLVYTKNGTIKEPSSDSKAITKAELFDYVFLTETLLWDEEIWVIDGVNPPTLQWQNNA